MKYALPISILFAATLIALPIADPSFQIGSVPLLSFLSLILTVIIIALTNEEEKEVERKIIQLTEKDGDLYALANDGTIWKQYLDKTSGQEKWREKRGIKL